MRKTEDFPLFPPDPDRTHRADLRCPDCRQVAQSIEIPPQHAGIATLSKCPCGSTRYDIEWLVLLSPSDTRHCGNRA